MGTIKLPPAKTHARPICAGVQRFFSAYHKSVRKQLWWMFKRMRYLFHQTQLEKGLKRQFKLRSRTVKKRLDQLQNLSINLVPLRKDFYLDQLPSLPLILELLENDSTAVRLKSDGTIEY